MVIKKNELFSFLVLVLVTFIICIFASIKQVPLSLVFLLIIFVFMFLFSLIEIEKRTALLVFLIAVFTFLIGRDILFYFFNFGSSIYTLQINEYAYKMITISLLTIFMSTLMIEKISFFKPNHSEKKNKVDFTKNFQNIVLFSFSFICIASIFYVIIKVRHVMNSGYLILYSEALRTSNSTLETLLLLINIALPASLSLTLVVIKNELQRKVVLLLYIIYILLTLGTGNRHEFVLGVLFLIFISICGKKSIKDIITVKYILIFFIMMFFIIGFSQFIANVRMDQDVNHKNALDLFFSFFYDQGVSITVIKQAKLLEHLIPNNKLYTLKFLFSGLPARIFNLPIYYGNTLENALYGNDFNHTLGYLVLGKNYLLGMGTGTSYIAEVVNDGGVYYLIFMNFIYALLLNRISNYYKYGFVKQTILLIILPSLIWAPRGNATAFIGDLIAPSVLLYVFFILISHKLFNGNSRTIKIANKIQGRFVDV